MIRVKEDTAVLLYDASYERVCVCVCVIECLIKKVRKNIHFS